MADKTVKEEKIRYPYFDGGLGREITGPRHRQEVMKELGVIEIGGEWEAAKKLFAEEAKAAEGNITVDDYERTMAECKEKLQNPDYNAYMSGRMDPEQAERFRKDHGL